MTAATPFRPFGSHIDLETAEAITQQIEKERAELRKIFSTSTIASSTNKPSIIIIATIAVAEITTPNICNLMNPSDVAFSWVARPVMPSVPSCHCRKG